MKIAINTTPLLAPLTGVGTYIYHISKSLRIIDSVNDYTYFYGFYCKKILTHKKVRVFSQISESIKQMPGCENIPRKLQSLANKLSKRSFDLYFEPNFIPINLKSRHTVVTIFDFSFMLYPAWHPQERINYFRKNFWKNIRRADKIIVISDYIKKEGIDFGLPEEKLSTIHLGFNHQVFKKYSSRELEAIRKKYELPEHFILFVGSLEPRKNLKNLIRAYNSFDDRIRKDIKLVLAGFKGWQNKEIMELLEKVRADVFYLRYLPEIELGKLYNLATVFVYPSMYEGFGLPPLEAMACGCPVVASNIASLPEVCGDAAYYVDPYSCESIAEGIYKVLTDETLRLSLREKGFEEAKRFSWEKSAQEHIKVFEEILVS